MGKVIGIDLGTTNSVVAVMEGNEPVVISNPEGGRLCPSVVAFTKDGERLVGQVAKRQAVTNADRTISSIKRHMGTNYTVKIDKDYTPQEISSMILQKLKKDAEAYLGHAVTEAVITVPAYFSDAQRQATKDAGKIAGLEVLRIINEPTAAALAYGLEKQKDQTVMVYDLGGGTFDVSILELGDGVFEVVATSGNNRLGGDDFDEAIINWLADDFKAQYGVDLRKDKTALQRLKEDAEKAKIELSQMTNTNINIPFISFGEEGPRHISTSITRAKFDELTRGLVDKSMKEVKKALEDSGLNINDIDQVILVGGSSRIPAVQEALQNFIGKEPHKGVNPDEVVALGAAIQGAVLAGDFKDIVLLDVTPLTLGIETLGGVTTKLIERNTTIPTSKSKTFTTAADGQTSVDIHVLQGERAMAGDNITLGRFTLSGIPAAQRGVPQIEVTFNIDANGIVHVKAKDLGTNKEQSITIQDNSGLSDQDIEKMVNDAERYKEEDEARMKGIETRNNAESLVYQSEKTLTENEDKLPEDKVAKVKEEIENVKKALEGTDNEAIEKASEGLTNAFFAISEELYKNASPEADAPEAGTVNEDGTVNAEYQVFDEEEK